MYNMQLIINSMYTYSRNGCKLFVLLKSLFRIGSRKAFEDALSKEAEIYREAEQKQFYHCIIVRIPNEMDCL